MGAVFVFVIDCLRTGGLINLPAATMRDGTLAETVLGDCRTGVGWGFTFCLSDNSPKGEWAVLGSTAIPRQPAGKSEQAPGSSPKFKNQFNIVDLQWRSYQILS